MAQDAPARPRRLEMVKPPEAKKGFGLLPRQRMVERSHTWAMRFRRLAYDDERLAETLAGLNLVAFAILMLRRIVELIVSSTYNTL